MGSTAAAAAASGPALQDAEDYAAAVTRSFARAMACAASYENGKSVEAVGTLPSEQRATWRAWICIGRAQMEMLEYEKVRAGVVTAAGGDADLSGLGVYTGGESFRSSSTRRAASARVDGAVFDSALAPALFYSTLVSLARSDAYCTKVVVSLDRFGQRLFAPRGPRDGAQVLQTSRSN